MKKKNFLLALCLVIIVAVSATLVACNETVEKYTVTFGGDGVVGFTQTVNNGGTASKPSDNPEKTGYTFEAWCLGDEEYDFSTPVTKDITLEAKWKANKYNVTLGEGGSQTKEVVFGEAYDLGMVSTDEFKDFLGWAIEGTLVTNEAGVSLSVWNIASDVVVNPVWTNDSKTVNGITYIKQSDNTLTATVTKAYNFESEVEIPSSVNGLPVTKIGAMQMLGAYEIKVPQSVKEISNSAFANNVYVEIVDLSDFSGSIGDMAFLNSEVKIIDLGNTVSIGAKAFENSTLSVVVIPASVESIGAGAFLSENIIEVGFMGNSFPVLGNSVFGDGRRDDGESIDFIAKDSAWFELGSTNEEIAEAMGIEAATLLQYSEEEITSASLMAGIFREKNNEVVAFKGLGTNALIYDYTECQINDLYDYSHAYRFTAENERETYVFDYLEKTVEKVLQNEKGESILGDVLYDYQGSDIVYYVPENITRVAGGVAFGNQTLRYVVFGDSVTEIGPYAFSFGRLFGTVFGKNLESIGEYAFFYQDYLQEIVFNGSTPPIIGEAAFCSISQLGIIPVTVLNGFTQYTGEAAYIYTPLSTSAWLGDPACLVYLNAFNASLDGLENLPMIGDKDDPDSYKPVCYELKQMKQLKTSNFNAVGAQYDSVYGKISMTGSDTGYAFISFSEDSGYSGDKYVYYGSMPGYSDSEVYKRLQIFTGYDANGNIESFIVYGMFKDGKFDLRGEEAGSYGELGKNVLSLDGFGKYVFYGENGTTSEGEYTVDGGKIVLDGISGTVLFDAEAKAITVNGETLTALGEEAGVYYDVNNAAKLTLSGKAYSEGTVKYNGQLVLEFKGQTAVTGYVIEKTSIKFTLNGAEKSWTYSLTSDNVISGYYDDVNYEDYLKFKVVENTIIDTFTNGQSTLALDGYFTATLDGDKSAYYRMFGDSNSVLLISNGEVKVAYLDLTNKTYEFASAPEAGKWFVTTSANYAWYLDGAGHLLYFSGDAYAGGTYEYNPATKEFAIVFDGNETLNNEKGVLDVENGYGSIVYNSGWSNSYAGLSKVEFDKVTSYGNALYVYSFVGALDGDNLISTSPYFTVYKAGAKAFVSVYGTPIKVVNLDSPTLVDGTAFDVEYTFEQSGKSITATFRFVFAVSDGTVSVSASPINYYSAQISAEYDGTSYNISFFDNTHVMIWSMGSWGGNVLESGEITVIDENTFTVGEYKVSGFGTANVTLEKVETPAE